MSTTTVEYVHGYEAKVVPTSYPPHGLNGMGYGNKITTDYMIRLAGEKVWRRVYTIQWSNNGSQYITVKGKNLYLVGTELEVALGH